VCENFVADNKILSQRLTMGGVALTVKDLSCKYLCVDVTLIADLAEQMAYMRRKHNVKFTLVAEFSMMSIM
jgi:hypothetical protein